jgi:hypothetical protein
VRSTGHDIQNRDVDAHGTAGPQVQGRSASLEWTMLRVSLRDQIQNEVRQITKVTDIAHVLVRWSGSGLAISAVEPTTVGVNEFWSGDRVSENVV